MDFFVQLCYIKLTHFSTRLFLVKTEKPDLWPLLAKNRHNLLIFSKFRLCTAPLDQTQVESVISSLASKKLEFWPIFGEKKSRRQNFLLEKVSAAMEDVLVP